MASWGDNGAGQIGAGYSGRIVTRPVLASLMGENVKQGASSGGYTLALQSNGTVLGCGGDNLGQLGAGTFDEKVLNPVKALATGVTQLSSGGGHTVARLDDGKVATWGGSLCGTLGNGVTGEGKESNIEARSAVPVYLDLTDVVEVAAGGGCCAARHANGTVSAWGENRKGTLGLGDVVERTTPVKVPGLKDVIKLSIGGMTTLPTHMLALLSDGTVMASGAGAGGQLGQGVAPIGTRKLADSLHFIAVPDLSDVIDIRAGSLASYALQSDGTLVGWGMNKHYQLALPILDQLVPAPTPILSSVAEFGTGYQYGAAIISGDLFVWGKGDKGCIGDGTLDDKPTPTLIPGLGDILALDCGETHMVALLRGSMAPPPVEITPGSGSLTLDWQSPETASKWYVGYRVAVLKKRTEPPEEFHRISVEAKARSHTFDGLAPGVTYEAFVQGPVWGRRTVEAAPL